MKKFIGRVVAIVFAILILGIVSGSFYTVPIKQYVAVRQFGRIVDIKDSPGLKFKVPFIQSIQRISAATILYDIPASDVITKDKKSMIADNYVLWRVVDPTRYIRTLDAVELRAEERTMILYEAPHHLRGTLQELYDNLGDRRITLCRELTKVHEEILYTTLSEVVELFKDKEPRGEYVLVVCGRDPRENREERKAGFSELSLSEHMALYTEKGMDRKEAMKAVALDRGVPKREIYKGLLDEKEEDE